MSWCSNRALKNEIVNSWPKYWYILYGKKFPRGRWGWWVALDVVNICLNWIERFKSWSKKKQSRCSSGEWNIRKCSSSWRQERIWLNGAKYHMWGEIHLNTYAISNHTCHVGVHNNVSCLVFSVKRKQTNDVGLTTVAGNQFIKGPKSLVCACSNWSHESQVRQTMLNLDQYIDVIRMHLM